MMNARYSRPDSACVSATTQPRDGGRPRLFASLAVAPLPSIVAGMTPPCTGSAAPRPSPSSPTTYLAAISSAIVRADARSIRNHAASLATQLSHGMI